MTTKSPREVVRGQLVKLRDKGLTPENVERFAPDFLALPSVQALWLDAPERRGDIGCGCLVAWFDAQRGAYDRYAKIAYKVEPIPDHVGPRLLDRREYAIDVIEPLTEAVRAPNTARYHEDATIERLLDELLPASSSERSRDSHHHELPVVEVLVDDIWTAIDVAPLDRPPPRSRNLRVLRQVMTNTYDSSRRLITQTRDYMVRAEGEPRRYQSWEMDYPGATIERFRLSDRNCRVANFAPSDRALTYWTLVIDYLLTLPVGREHEFGYTIEIEGRGDYENFIPFMHTYALERLTLRALFSPSCLPRRAWWFDDLAYNAVPGYAHPQQLLPVPTPNHPELEYTFGEPRPPSAHACGIAWEW